MDAELKKARRTLAAAALALAAAAAPAAAHFEPDPNIQAKFTGQPGAETLTLELGNGSQQVITVTRLKAVGGFQIPLERRTGAAGAEAWAPAAPTIEPGQTIRLGPPEYRLRLEPGDAERVSAAGVLVELSPLGAYLVRYGASGAYPQGGHGH